MDKPKSAKQIKKGKVEALIEKIKTAKSLTFTNYHGLSAEQIAQLRVNIKAAGGEFLVEKNTLIKLALTANKMLVPKEQLTGPTSIVLAYEDEINPIKEIAQSKKSIGFPSFKFGFLGQHFLDLDNIEKLSQLPSRETLQAQVVGSLSSPIYGFVNVLSANLRSLVSVIDQAAKKGQSA